MLTEFTTYDDVRGALGVSDEELSDDTLSLETPLTLLEEDLLEVHADLLPTWQALPDDPDTDSSLQSRFRKLVRLYSTYSVASQLLTSAELFGFLKVADGRAATERVPEAYQNLRVDIAVMLAKVRAKLLAALVALVPATSLPVASGMTFISSTGIAVDPVTGA